MLNKKEIIILEKLIKKYSNKQDNKIIKYPLLDEGFSNRDIIEGIQVLISKKITMSDLTKKFESEFANYVGAKYALMVNSGSSANLLAAFALINPNKKNNLKHNDKIIVPALCWPTSLWPFIQSGLKPIFVDVNINNFGIDESSLTKNILKKSRAIVLIHVLGNSANVKKISDLASDNNIYLIEDTCEALGSKYNNKYLGTYGDFGTYSFYYSHQITSGEGGMIVCKNKENYDLLRSLRSHGWDRELYKKNKKDFNFINSGFNLRPMEVNAAIGLSQLKRFNKMIKIRSKNRELIINNLKNSSKWKNQFTFFINDPKVKPSWFGLPILLNYNYVKKKNNFLKYLNNSGIETRPIISGNFLNQPASYLYNLNPQNKKFKNAQKIEDSGFFIGIPTEIINKKKIDFLINKLLNIDNI